MQGATVKSNLDKMIESGHLSTTSTFRSVIEGPYSNDRFQTANMVMRSMLEKDIK